MRSAFIEQEKCGRARSFHLALNSENLRPIKEIRVDPDTRKEVPWDKVVHGVEYRKGEFVGISGKELESLPLPRAGAIDIWGLQTRQQSVPSFSTRRTMLPRARMGPKAYELFRRA